MNYRWYVADADGTEVTDSSVAVDTSDVTNTIGFGDFSVSVFGQSVSITYLHNFNVIL